MYEDGGEKGGRVYYVISNYYSFIVSFGCIQYCKYIFNL